MTGKHLTCLPVCFFPCFISLIFVTKCSVRGTGTETNIERECGIHQIIVRVDFLVDVSLEGFFPLFSLCSSLFPLISIPFYFCPLQNHVYLFDTLGNVLEQKSTERNAFTAGITHNDVDLHFSRFWSPGSWYKHFCLFSFFIYRSLVSIFSPPVSFLSVQCPPSKSSVLSNSDRTF